MWSFSSMWWCKVLFFKHMYIFPDIVILDFSLRVGWEEELGDDNRVLDEVSNVHGHLVDAGVVELFDVVEGSLVLVSHKVDGDALSAETTAAADPAKEHI